MVEVAQRPLESMRSKMLSHSPAITIPPQKTAEQLSSRQPMRSQLDAFSPVNQNGSFEFDRIVKSGYLQKRTQKTKAWKPVYLVLRPNTLFIYKSDKESKLRHKIYLSDLSAVTHLKDPKQKRKNLFGLYSPAKNFHFEAPSAKEAQEWIELIRSDARIEEEEEEMFLASPIIRRQSYAPSTTLNGKRGTTPNTLLERDRFASSSPEPLDNPVPHFAPTPNRRPSHNVESSGWSGNELASHSDFSDTDVQRIQGASIESLAVQDHPGLDESGANDRPGIGHRNGSQLSGLNMEQDPDRVVWQGWLKLLKSKGGVRQWKHCWAVLRPRNLILYKDESEYTAQAIFDLSSVLNVVDIDPVSRTKLHCLQLITDEKSFRFCACTEEDLLQCLGAFKSLLIKRKEIELKRVAAGNSAT